jgi:hypothetical protein
LSPKIVSRKRFARRRLEKFRKQCAEFCETRKEFYKRFEIDQYHITKQGMAKDIKRLAITNEDLAALIQQGEMNFDNCVDGPPIRIAIEGVFENFEWFNVETNKYQLDMDQEVRVLVQEGKFKNLVVTAYTIRPKLKYKVPMIDRDVW